MQRNTMTLLIHKKKSLFQGISPVIATVIIVAIAIALAIAIAFWSAGITSSFTRFEKIEIVAAWSDSSEKCVWMKIFNSGPSEVHVDDLYVNGKPFDFLGILVSGSPTLDFTMETGDSALLKVELDTYYKPGVTLEIALHTTTGKTFPSSVTLG